MDEDLEGLTREQLMGEARRLRAGIREHRDSTGHALCWHHPRLWAASCASFRGAVSAVTPERRIDR